MAERSAVISGATVGLFALVDGIDGPIPLALVENFTLNESTATERITGIGSVRPDENVMHGTGGADVSWGNVLKGTGRNPWSDKILADARSVPSHRPIELVAVDNNSGLTLAIVHKVLPQSVGINISPQTSVRANMSFTATHASWITEVN
jgi:hypothetical protein